MGFFSNLVGKVSTGLDIVSGILLEPTTFIKSPTKAGLLVKERRRKVRSQPKGLKTINIPALKVVGETLLSGGILAAGLLGAGTVAGRALVVRTVPKVVKAAIPKTIGGALGTIAVSGVLVSSPKARSAAKALPKTVFTGGQILGGVLEGKDTGLGIGKAILTGGLLGGGAIAVKKGIDIIKGGKDTPLTTGLISSPGAIPPTFDVVGVAEQPKPKEEAEVKPLMPTINNRITVKPEINVRVSRRKQTFINQQVLQMV